MAKTVRVKVNDRGLRAMMRKLRVFPHHPIISRMLKQWAVRYRRFTRQRFDRYSKGSGDWAPLSPATVAGRRRGSRADKNATRLVGGPVSILRDTNTLFNATEPVFANLPGQHEKELPEAIEVGFDGPGRHPKGDATIADIARFHHFGEGNLPERKILDEPDAQTMFGIENDAQRAMQNLVNDSDIGGRVG